MKLSKGWLITIFVLAMLIIDQIIKIVVKLDMTVGESIPIFGSWSQILFIENNGMAFGMQLGGMIGKLILSLLRIVLIVAIIWYLVLLLKEERQFLNGTDNIGCKCKISKKLWHDLKPRRVPAGVFVGIALLLVGAIGNMIDSAFYGLIFSESTYSTVATIFPEGGGYAPFLCGKVVDMFYFPLVDTVLPDWVPFWGGENFVFFRPIFNFADSCVTVGVFYLLLFQRHFFSKASK